MLRVEGVRTRGIDAAGFEVQAGECAAVVTASDTCRVELLRVILGLNPPAAGRALVGGKDVAKASGRELGAMRRRVGVVWSDGGLISNLKTGENIMLPVWYHRRRWTPADGELAGEVLERLGVPRDGRKAFYGTAPAALTTARKRAAALARAALMDPDLVIFDGTLDGLADEAGAALAETAAWFHARRPGRATLFVTAEEESLRDVPARLAARQRGRRLEA